MVLSVANLRPADDEIPTFGEPDPGREARAVEQERKATEAVFLALKALSHRALVALAALEHLLLAGSVFALWLTIVPNPTQLQLIGGSIYSAFVLALIWIRKRS